MYLRGGVVPKTNTPRYAHFTKPRRHSLNTGQAPWCFAVPRGYQRDWKIITVQSISRQRGYKISTFYSGTRAHVAINKVHMIRNTGAWQAARTAPRGKHHRSSGTNPQHHAKCIIHTPAHIHEHVLHTAQLYTVGPHIYDAPLTPDLALPQQRIHGPPVVHALAYTSYPNMVYNDQQPGTNTAVKTSSSCAKYGTCALRQRAELVFCKGVN